MSADLVLHIRTDNIGEDVLELFFSNVIGSKYFKGFFGSYNIKEMDKKEKEIENKYGKKSYSIIADTPSFDIGECSFLKANLLNDNDTFIPDMVGIIADVFKNHPIITDKLIDNLKAQLKDVINKTTYSVTDNKDGLFEFLKKYKGKEAFTVAW